MSRVKFVSANEAVDLIKDGSFVANGGFVGIGVAEEVLERLENRYKNTGSPRDLSLIYTAGQGDGKTKGLNHFGQEGMVKKVIGGHWGLAPSLGKLANEEKLQGYNLPQGVISHIFRDLAAGKPGTLTHVGLGTFVDPEISGGKINLSTTEDVVEKMKIGKKDYLFYNIEKIVPKIDYAIIRGSSADENGNISMEKEALTLETLSIAMATRNTGGKVIVQVEKRVKSGSIDPKLVKIPGILVDYVVVSEVPSENHMQTFSEIFNESYVNSAISISEGSLDFPLNERKVIARRCAMLLSEETRILNYGIGMPEGIAAVLNEEGKEKNFIPTVEPGAIGGTPVGGLSFGAAITPEAIIDQSYQFDYYNGGGLDMAFLGLAQCDEHGNINVSKFGPKIAGCGGFIDITQNAKQVVFCGTFTAGGLKVEAENGKLSIINEGKFSKFLKDVEQITFSGELANKQNKNIFYVTERAVFKLKKEGLELIEIAPGVDLEKDILENMDFKPMISDDLKLMDERIFKDELMGLNF
ncbi:acyl CoA:acetate/3-ketoacid CoA transferase [uncultured Ilyobacter sp.]|uniref:acyl CoA:acetate/3-ketoacid CoA transferase n=1 Tax=uncultured Ilyobacter sp. TaxID=544433 RepID=UPI0029C0BE66|nr:acyl CoA:acetate/3-ketoacid CoA transferase [uncultured Ilyobacter sp.]